MEEEGRIREEESGIAVVDIEQGYTSGDASLDTFDSAEHTTSDSEDSHSEEDEDEEESSSSSEDHDDEHPGELISSIRPTIANGLGNFDTLSSVNPEQPNPKAEGKVPPRPKLLRSQGSSIGMSIRGKTAIRSSSNIVDISTGKKGVRGHEIHIRKNPSSHELRRNSWVSQWFRRDDENVSRRSRGSRARGLNLDQPNENPTQYRLSSVKHIRTKKPSIFSCCWPEKEQLNDEPIAGSSRGCCYCPNLSPDQLATRFLYWSFRSPFLLVFVAACFGFFALVIFFAFFIWVIGWTRPYCVGGVDFGNSRGRFTDAYALSWTTFSTVGYGLIFPSTSNDVKHIHKCTGITILTSLEAFVGVLFSSVCGAIIFAKIARVQSFAQVQFSDPIVIRYGAGVAMAENKYGDDGSDGDTEKKIPCPVLEFRVFNRLSSLKGGEIIDATLNMVASVDISQADTIVGRQGQTKRRGKKGRRRAAARRTNFRGDSDLNECTKEDSAKNLALILHPKTPKHTTKFDEGKRILSKCEVESPDHPFFKRIWLVRHVLDMDSPLLKTAARQLIRNNHGFWPKELNNHEGVRAAIQFEQILVSLSGTSNADANSVYAQHVYHMFDVHVGYRFVNALYKPADGGLLVDSTLINDVMEQAGGGGAPFKQLVDKDFTDIDVL